MKAKTVKAVVAFFGIMIIIISGIFKVFEAIVRKYHRLKWIAAQKFLKWTNNVSFFVKHPTPSLISSSHSSQNSKFYMGLFNFVIKFFYWNLKWISSKYFFKDNAILNITFFLELLKERKLCWVKSMEDFWWNLRHCWQLTPKKLTPY